MVTLQTCKIHPDSMSNSMTTDFTNIYFPKEIYLYYNNYKKKLYKTLFFPLFHLWSSTFIFFEKNHMFLVRKFSHFFTLVFDAKWSKHALLVSTFQFQIDQFFLLWKFQTSKHSILNLSFEQTTIYLVISFVRSCVHLLFENTLKKESTFYRKSTFLLWVLKWKEHLNEKQCI